MHAAKNIAAWYFTYCFLLVPFHVLSESGLEVLHVVLSNHFSQTSDEVEL